MINSLIAAQARHEERYWPIDRELAAQAVEHLSYLAHIHLKTWSGKGAQVSEPIRIPRPFDDAANDEPIGPGDMAAQLMAAN